ALMQQTPVDYTIFFRELSNLPETMEPLRASFYRDPAEGDTGWSAWFQSWREALQLDDSERSAQKVAERMKAVNPTTILREWQLAPAYREAAQGDYRLIGELQAVMTQPYAEPDRDTPGNYYALKPAATFGVGGISHMSCSS
ncbi:MAG: protein adenylyltransferase SelO family protein, partial [Myxococcota bacterium]